MKKFERALITGAAKGLGKYITQELAPRCQNLVLLGRDESSLQAFKKELQSSLGFSGEIDILLVDLGSSQALDKVKAYGKEVDLLINNAGIGFVNEFTKMTEQELQNMMTINIQSLTLLTHYYARKMAEQGGGQVLNIASAAAFLPVPYFSAYSATKSYVLNLSVALDNELKERGVRVKVLSPGGIKTNFHLSAGMSDRAITDNKNVIALPEDVARSVLKLLESDCSEMTHGAPNKVLGFLSRILPRTVAATLAGRSYKKYVPS